MVIVALDHVAHCYTYDDGLQISLLVAACLHAGDSVVLSFKGVSGVPSSFVNGAFVSLLSSFPPDVIKSCVKVVDSTRQINDLIRSRVIGGTSHVSDLVLAE